MDRALRSLVDWYERVGVDVPDIVPTPMARKTRAPIAQQTKPRPQAKTPAPLRASKSDDAPLPASVDVAKACKTLDELRLAMQKFDAGALSDGARQMVFARGNPDADLMIIGEAPGRDEDIQGQPFLGQTGELLNKMLASIGLAEEQFYVTNCVNWRPPKNRNPKPEEIELCRPFWEKHIELARPKVILLVGGVSMTALTGLTGIMKHHGQWEDVSIGELTLPVIPIYHPAFLLRQPALKKEAWRDLLSLRAKLEE